MGLSKRQRGGIKGRLKHLQRASRANFEDIAMFRSGMYSLREGSEIRKAAVNQIIHMQHLHRRNSMHARELLFKLIEDTSNAE